MVNSSTPGTKICNRRRTSGYRRKHYQTCNSTVHCFNYSPISGSYRCCGWPHTVLLFCDFYKWWCISSSVISYIFSWILLTVDNRIWYMFKSKAKYSARSVFYLYIFVIICSDQWEKMVNVLITIQILNFSMLSFPYKNILRLLTIYIKTCIVMIVKVSALFVLLNWCKK